MSAPDKYTPDEALDILMKASESAIAETMPTIERFMLIESDTEEALDAVLADPDLVKYAAAMQSFVVQFQSRGWRLDDPDPAKRMGYLLKFTIWFYMYKQDILNRLGVEE